MVIHYSQGLSSSSCGRTGATITTTKAQGQVTCKTCLRSLKAAETAESVSPTASAVVEPKSRIQSSPRAAKRAVHNPAKLSASASWRNRLAQMPGRNRLPRGARQVYI